MIRRILSWAFVLLGFLFLLVIRIALATATRRVPG